MSLACWAWLARTSGTFRVQGWTILHMMGEAGKMRTIEYSITLVDGRYFDAARIGGACSTEGFLSAVKGEVTFTTMMRTRFYLYSAKSKPTNQPTKRRGNLYYHDADLVLFVFRQIVPQEPLRGDRFQLVFCFAELLTWFAICTQLFR